MTSERTRRDFRLDIQGLRALAVGSVVLYHASVPFVTGGYVGVDIFFVISGFLITSHLLRSLQSNGRIGFADFYARRARRILPASFVVLILTVIGSLIWLPPLQLKSMLQGAIATALYVPNYYFAAIGTSYLSETTPSLFQHYWSLGVEEQFYLFWPALLALAFFVFRKSRRGILAVLIATVVISFGLCLLLTTIDQPWAFFSLPTRAWELGVGGLVAYLVASDARVFRWRGMGIVAWVGLAGLVAICLTFTSGTPFPSFYAAFPVVATALVIAGGVADAPWGPARALSIRPLVFIGTISYSLYLVHWPILLLSQAAVGQRSPLPLWATVLLAVVCVPVAWALYRFVENPFRQHRFLAGARARRTLLLTGATSLVVVGLCAASIQVVQRVPLSSDQAAAAYTPTIDPAGTGFVPSNLTPALSKASDDNPEIYDDGCHLDFDSTDSAGCPFGQTSAPSVVLFGDSHAAQWFPPLRKLADDGEIMLDSNTKSSCSSIIVTSLLNNEPYPECTAWRTGVIDRLNASPPAVIILANYARDIDVANGTEDFSTYWGEGLRATIEALPKQSKIIVVGETATMGITPAICLSAHLTDADYCGRSPAAAIDTPTFDAERAVTEGAGASFLDMNPYLCNNTLCPPIIGDTLVYRDDHHLTVTFTSGLSDVLLREIRTALASG
ncbi:acyltransferase family protein [Subtercola boreus]|uniref:acyltransferase family protein n=1 Tax=Subtercola boreus TaxID=120213 RepID=UPI00209BD978|nr:acyltransferase family protein [Subtercola boreus]